MTSPRANVVWRALALPIVIVAASGLGACRSSSPATNAERDAAAGPAAADCTLATRLVPGVPGSPGHLIASERNPNGVSELAALMRTMADDMGRTRDALRSGARPASIGSRHSKLRCAWPTEAHDRDAAFDARASVYLDRIRALDAAPTPATYANVVAACRACHEVTCSGVLQLLDGLALDAK